MKLKSVVWNDNYVEKRVDINGLDIGQDGSMVNNASVVCMSNGWVYISFRDINSLIKLGVELICDNGERIDISHYAALKLMDRKNLVDNESLENCIIHFRYDRIYNDAICRTVIGGFSINIEVTDIVRYHKDKNNLIRFGLG